VDSLLASVAGEVSLRHACFALRAVEQDWDAFELDALAADVRSRTTPADAEKTVWAFEQAVAVARIDEGLLDYVFVAALCLMARRDATTPRSILDLFFRRSVSDRSWNDDVLPLLS
jgi:hypothetical protein